MRFTIQTNDARIKYREFCKFLSKRFVKTFKLAGKDNKHEEDNSRAKTAVELEAERPTIKENSLSYILRKTAEL